MFRFGPLLAQSPALKACVLAIGLATALFAAVAGRVQTDIKCALAFASMTQVGLITAEIGLGWHYIPLVHLIGHACLRTLQFLRAPSLLLDSTTIENAVGQKMARGGDRWVSRLPESWQRRLYWFGIERGSWDGWLHRFVVMPFLQMFRTFDAWERRWTDWLNGAPPRTPHQSGGHAESLGEAP